MSLKVGITFDLYADYIRDGYSELEAAEFDSEDTIDNIESNLRRLGFITERIGNAKTLMHALGDGRRWDLVFNICEGLRGMGRESLVPSVLDSYEIPYTFSDPLALALALHKGMAKRVMRDIGIVTPAFAIVEKPGDIDGITLPFPLFAKPVAEGTSKGIDSSSHVTNHAELRQTCLRLLKVFRQPVLVEQFLPGREFTIGVIGSGADAAAIGGMEIILRAGAEPYAYSYHNKREWEELVEYRPIAPAILAECAEIGLPAWRSLGCRDAGRIDFREDENGRISVLEINPLPGLNEYRSDLSILCRICDIDYPQLIERIMVATLLRTGLEQAPRTGPGQARIASA